MWTHLKSQISRQLCASIIDDIKDSKLNQHEKASINASGATYFRSLKGLKILINILKNLDPSLIAIYKNPCVDHAFLMVKSPSNDEDKFSSITPIHQDIAFWKNKGNNNNQTSLITVWCALDQIGIDNGCLVLANEERGDVSQLGSYCNMHKHEEFEEPNGVGTTFRLCSDYEFELVPQPLDTGDALVFDAYSPHGSTSNISSQPRYAMKIVLGESLDVSPGFFNALSLRNMLKLNLYLCYFYMVAKAALRKIFRN
jgi:ectoine hydroxylase-related dioxygenase (phytanoyl-CoA dioxygenase family)